MLTCVNRGNNSIHIGSRITIYHKQKLSTTCDRYSHLIDTLHDTVVAVVDASSFPTRTLKYAGWCGLARILVLLLSITTTSNIVGRSTAFSCTQSNPMFMHLIINSSEWCMDNNEASTSSLHLPSSYNCHVCLEFHHTIINVDRYQSNKIKFHACKPINLHIQGYWWNLHSHGYQNSFFR